MTATDHEITREEANTLKGIAGLPREIRIEALTKLMPPERMLSLAADLIGLGNQLNASTREFLEFYLVIEGKEDPHAVEKINLPTVFGALNGIEIAVKPVRGMCNGCAFRQRTPANQSPITSFDAADSVRGAISQDFMCHMRPNKHGECLVPCFGARAAKKQRRGRR